MAYLIIIKEHFFAVLEFITINLVVTIAIKIQFLHPPPLHLPKIYSQNQMFIARDFQFFLIQLVSRSITLLCIAKILFLINCI